MKHVLITILLFIFLPLVASEVDSEGARPGVWTRDEEAAKRLAQTKGLPLFYQFTGSDWCYWCKLMDQNVFSRNEWKSFSKNIVLVFLDFPKDKSLVTAEIAARNKSLAATYGIRGYPTYLLFESDGRKIIGRLGAGEGKTPETFAGEVEDALFHSKAPMEALAARMDRARKSEYLEAARELWATQESPKPDPGNYKEALARVRQLESDFFATLLGKADLKAYKSLVEERESIEGEMKDFFATKPKWDTANRQKVSDFSKQIMEKDQAIRALEKKARWTKGDT